MDSLVVKALCRRIRDRYGSNEKAALAAGVTGGVFSGYCSDEHPDTTIPFHRLLLIANGPERQAFSTLLLGDEAALAADLLTEACEVGEAGIDLQRAAREAVADGKLTPLERRRLRDGALEVQAQAADVLRLVGGTDAA